MKLAFSVLSRHLYRAFKVLSAVSILLIETVAIAVAQCPSTLNSNQEHAVPINDLKTPLLNSTSAFNVEPDEASCPKSISTTAGKFQGEIWEISTRHLGCCLSRAQVDSPDLKVSRLERGVWRRSDLATFFDATGRIDDLADPSVIETPPLTIYYVHGNWMNVQNTRERVQTINRTLSKLAVRPYRLVVLSWPSQRDRGILTDIRENGDCADIQSHYLMHLINNTSLESQISLMGFSFGARTVTGTLHMLSGGSLHGIQSNAEAVQTDRKFRVTLIAPAVDRNWLVPNGRFGLAANSIEWMVNLYNSRDPVLRRFRFISLATDPIAAGFRGFGQISDPRVTEPMNYSEVLEQFDCGGVVGTSHDEQTYYSGCAYFKKGAQNLLWQYP